MSTQQPCINNCPRPVLSCALSTKPLMLRHSEEDYHRHCSIPRLDLVRYSVTYQSMYLLHQHNWTWQLPPGTCHMLTRRCLPLLLLSWVPVLPLSMYPFYNLCQSWMSSPYLPAFETTRNWERWACCYLICPPTRTHTHTQIHKCSSLSDVSMLECLLSCHVDISM